VASSFVFVPAVPPKDVFTYLELADVLVTTRSTGTNTPLKIYQYLRAGKPIVATNIHSHTQVLNDSCSELVSPEPAHVAAGLVRVLKNPDRGRALAEAASHLARDEYSEEAYMSRLQGLLQEMFSNGKSARKE
jgi:glycosyltransferase involved in cell wall biosynthesis